MKKTRTFELDEDNEVPQVSFNEKEAFLKGLKSNDKDEKVEISFDPKAKPIYGINIRLNDYQLNLIRKVCKKEERSQQQIIKRILVPALESHLKKLNI